MKFKPGDRITCIEANISPQAILVKGKQYTVGNVADGMIFLKELRWEQNGWLAWRFEHTKEHLFDKLYLRLK